MLKQSLRDIFRHLLIGSLLIAFGQSAYAQDQTQPAGNAPTRRKPSADTCDGALDIVPAKSMSFTRKRLRQKAEQSSSADAKEAKDVKDSKDAKDTKEAKDTKDGKDVKDAKPEK